MVWLPLNISSKFVHHLVDYQMVNKFRRYVYSFWHDPRTWQTHRQTDGQTDEQTDTAWRHRPRLCIALRGKSYDNMLSRFHLIPERHGRTDGQTNRQNCYISIAHQHTDGFSKKKLSSLELSSLLTTNTKSCMALSKKWEPIIGPLKFKMVAI